MRLGIAWNPPHQDPDEWARKVREAGYRAATCPIDPTADEATVRAYAAAAEAHDVAISEVGAWSNPVDPNPERARSAKERCEKSLDLADRIGARCCVTIAGARGPQWDGPYPGNFAPETFEMIVHFVRGLLDTVKPTRTFFTLEAMPWALPDSPDSYLELIRAIDRDRFAVHLDPVNMISSPRRYFDNAEFLRECFQKLGPYIKNVHGKDIRLGGKLTTHLDEVIPGQGTLDYRVFLHEMNKLDDVPLILEHLQTEAQYTQAAGYVRHVAGQEGIEL